MVQDGPKKRPTLETNPDTSPIVKRIFNMAEAAKGTLEITRILNNEGIASPRGKLWGQTSVHGILINEAYTGTLVWGLKAKTRPNRSGWRRPFPPSSPRPSSAVSISSCAPAHPSSATHEGSEAPTCSAV